MALFTVDSNTCRRDGICAAVCPVGIIDFAREKGFPTPTVGLEGLCFHCGHCVASCPHGALSLDTMTPEDCLPIRKELKLTPEQCRQFFSSRRSIRVYKRKPVDRNLLTQMIEMASYAPTGQNVQPVKWLVVDGSEKVRSMALLVMDWIDGVMKDPVLSQQFKPLRLERLVEAWGKGEDRVCRDAPHMLLAYASVGGEKTSPKGAEWAALIALTYLELAAFSFDVGACWGGLFNLAANIFPPLTKALGLPENHASFGTMLVGYPKHPYYRIPLRNRPDVTWL